MAVYKRIICSLVLMFAFVSPSYAENDITNTKTVTLTAEIADLQGDLGNLEKLVNLGVKLNANNKYGEEALMLATRYGDLKIVQALIEGEVNVNTRNSIFGHTPLHLATFNADVTKELISAGANVNAKDKRKRTPLHWAIGRNSAKSVALLIDNGAKVNVKDINGNTPLHWAAGKGQEATQVLIEKGNRVKLNARNKWGETPLHEALQNKNTYIETAQLLISAGADVNAQDAKGRTPLITVTTNLDIADADLLLIIQSLIEKGAEVDAKDMGHNTALHWAVNRGNVTATQKLISAGAEVKARNISGWTPLYMVKKEIAFARRSPIPSTFELTQYQEIVELLEKGARSGKTSQSSKNCKGPFLSK